MTQAHGQEVWQSGREPCGRSYGCETCVTPLSTNKWLQMLQVVHYRSTGLQQMNALVWSQSCVQCNDKDLFGDLLLQFGMVDALLTTMLTLDRHVSMLASHQDSIGDSVCNMSPHLFWRLSSENHVRAVQHFSKDFLQEEQNVGEGGTLYDSSERMTADTTSGIEDQQTGTSEDHCFRMISRKHFLSRHAYVEVCLSAHLRDRLQGRRVRAP